jgi:hypothetical protein
MNQPLFTFHTHLDRGGYGFDLHCAVFKVQPLGICVRSELYGPEIALSRFERMQLHKEAMPHYEAWQGQQTVLRDRKLQLSRYHYLEPEQAEMREEEAHCGLSVAKRD